MRIVLIAVATVLSSVVAEAAVAHVQSTAGYCNGGSGTAGNMNGTGCNGSMVTKTFSFTPTNTGDAVVIAVGCAAASGTVTAVTLSATSWTFTQIGGIAGNTTNGFIALFRAYSPNTSAATITMTWTVSANCGGFLNNAISEFSGADATNFADGNNSATGSGTPTLSVTPTGNNDMIWIAGNDSITAVGNIGGSTATKGADDTVGDWSEYRLISGGAGSGQSCTLTGSGTYTIVGVAIKASGGAVAAPKTLTLLGVGD